MLPSEICFTAAGFRVRPSRVRGVWASREWVYEGEEAEGEVSYFVMGREGLRKGREKPKAITSGRARWRKSLECDVGRKRWSGWRSMVVR